jgi:mRNA interferase MazF
MERGEIYWVDLPDPVGSGPGYRRPMLVVQDDLLNAARLRTSIMLAISTNLGMVRLRGNLLLRAEETGLPKDSVLLANYIYTVDRSVVGDLAGQVPDHLMLSVDMSLRLVLGL